MKMYRCLVCGEIFPMTLTECPTCGVGVESFEIIDVPDLKENNQCFNLVIVGAGIAGLTVASEVRSINKKCNITLIGKEKHLPYNRTLLTKNFNADLDHIDIKDKTFFRENNINLLLGKEATKIDSINQELILADGEKLAYDYLVLATGSQSIMLNSGDFNKNHVLGIRTKEDVLNLREMLGEGNKTVTIVGGGVLGLELASELALKNRVNIIEKAPYLMFNNFGVTDSKKLKKFLKSKGINIYENTSIIKYNYDNVILEDETKLDTDFIIYSIGVASNINLAKTADIKTNRGILVNNHLETSIKNIYACGDSCEFDGKVVALWSNALDMANTVAKNINGANLTFERGLYPLAFKLFENSYYKIGRLSNDAVIEDSNKSLIKYYYEDEILVGALIINNESKHSDVYRSILNKDIKVEY